MRVISGTAKGRRLTAPKGIQTRPVLDQVKESVFNILFDVNGLNVLDLFAGTGSMGIEAISRGAVHSTFVENNKAALISLFKNLEITGFKQASTVIQKTVEDAIKILKKRSHKFDLIFVDPPYRKGLVNKTLSSLSLADLLSNNGVIIIEHCPEEMPQTPPPFILTDMRKYGQTRISFIKKSP